MEHYIVDKGAAGWNYVGPFQLFNAAWTYKNSRNMGGFVASTPVALPPDFAAPNTLTAPVQGH